MSKADSMGAAIVTVVALSLVACVVSYVIMKALLFAGIAVNTSSIFLLLAWGALTMMFLPFFFWNIFRFFIIKNDKMLFVMFDIAPTMFGASFFGIVLGFLIMFQELIYSEKVIMIAMSIIMISVSLFLGYRGRNSEVGL
ncbi:MAG: hypothetical protein KAI71_06390 [Candidatus Pacebacteria bacterium]|nr:hypothetical protein [Candidatus Paceibacterota bacterium]